MENMYAISGRMSSADGLIRSQRKVLEVVINRPDLFEKICNVIRDPSDFIDPDLGLIAEYIWPYYAGGEAISLEEILAGCDSDCVRDKIIGLADRGADRGNYWPTLKDATENIQRIKDNERRWEIRMALKAGKLDKDAETSLLREFQSLARRRWRSE